MGRHGGYSDLPILTELYDHSPQYAGRGDVDFFASYSLSAGGRTLELGCGTGRVLIPTARAGCGITGLDLSERMLGRCREKLALQPSEVRERVQLVRGYMTDFELDDTFQLVTTPFRPFQHLITVDEQLACLRCVNRHLAVGGKLILDLFQVKLRKLTDPAALEEHRDPSDVPLPGGRTLSGRGDRIAARHPAEQYNDIEIAYYVTHPDGREDRMVHAFPMRYFFRYEVEHLLARCGFAVVDLFGSYDRSPLGDDSPEMIFVAEKTG